MSRSSSSNTPTKEKDSNNKSPKRDDSSSKGNRFQPY